MSRYLRACEMEDWLIARMQAERQRQTSPSPHAFYQPARPAEAQQDNRSQHAQNDNAHAKTTKTG